MGEKAKVCLIVIDGWGISEHKDGNAILNANTPTMDSFCQPSDHYATLDASSLAVGLPKGLMGNSEVGHLTIGSGRVIYQAIVMIDLAIEKGEFFKKEAFVNACDRAKNGNGRLHFLGLVSDGGVHSHMHHLLTMLEGAKQAGVPKSFVHFFGDGRDTAPTSGVKYIQQVLDHTEKQKYGSLATIIGRYYAMDRDKRHERTKLAYEGLVQGIGTATTKEKVIEHCNSLYKLEGDKCEKDEFFKPIIVDKEGCIQDGDTLIFINFRADRARQLSEAIGIKPPFETSVIPKNLGITTMNEYKAEFPFPVIFPPQPTSNVLAECVSKQNLTQFHCAETEKYAHVTFFFNGGQEKQFDKEDRCLVPSPKVATYDLKPEMSVMGVAEKMIEAVKSGNYPFVMCNMAPPDMVGHTGVYDAAVQGCEHTDKAIKLVHEACKECGYVLLITADHGNAEVMKYEDGSPSTKHTTNRVPFVMQGGNRKFKYDASHNCSLPDVAPTILDLMGIPKPAEMGGISLLE
ncbi:2,3-bisphosphoglycerate-independent phosphoglycerate mutase-like [Amphiura filiformis]|uniref:2,3-bisphosphoglycerate-independent phosphoglycerate mutase-like n=1 Tax=Amphiura filiformis TaxID=82378 RepID=UPI003B2183D9